MKTSIAQYIILGIFILFLVGGVIIFAKFSGSNNTTATAAQISIWGALPEAVFSNVTQSINSKSSGAVNVTYKQIPQDSFEQTLIEALADGTGPDVVLMPNNLLVKNQKKFTIIGYDVLSERTFRDTFAQAGETLLTSKGTYGVPLLIDPLVMYWNKDILTTKNIARPPTTWEEVLALAENLTQRRDDRSIVKSALALGDYTNVRYSKDILLALAMQAGGTFLVRDANTDALSDALTVNNGTDTNPFTLAISFFTQFSDPLKSIYTWNRSLPDSETAFINGDLAFYFGHASDAYDIRAKNPNLNFDVTTLPQPKTANRALTEGDVYSFFILSSSPYKLDAYTNINVLTSAYASSLFSSATGLPPARTDLLSVLPGSAFGDVFWKSALWAKSYLDPEPQKTDLMLANAINSVVTGSAKPTDVSGLVNSQIEELLR